jgi:hypothetical protein
MLLLGDWQLHRAKSGNELSWAYTFEWPLFAAFTVYFWIKSLRDELRQDAANADRAGPAVATPGQEAGVAPEAGVPIVDVRRATPADGEAYVARLTAEVQRHGRWHGWR